MPVAVTPGATQGDTDAPVPGDAKDISARSGLPHPLNRATVTGMETSIDRQLTHRADCQTSSAVGCTCGVLDRWREWSEDRAADRQHEIEWNDGR